MEARGSTPIGVISNPNSRKNRKDPPGRIERLRKILGPLGEVHETRTVEEIRPTLKHLMSRGARYLVSDGGDGTAHWMLNEVDELARESDIAQVPPTLPTNGGTIDFMARKAGIRGRGPDILRALAERLHAGDEAPLVELDSLEVTGTRRTIEGSVPFRKIGFAMAAGGIGQRFFEQYYRVPDPGAHTIVSVVAKATMSHLAAMIPAPLPDRMLQFGHEMFRPTPARVTIDGSEHPCREHGAIHAGAFDVELGGVFKVFPLAKRDGELHFQAGGITPVEIIRALPDLHRGGAIRSKDMVDVAGHEMTIEATTDELLRPNIDGEPYTNIERMTVRRGPRVRVAQVNTGAD